jgi:hypothetical protein
MSKEFIYTEVFERTWEKLGLDDEDLRELEKLLIKNTAFGDVIKHSLSCRKMRFALENRGKSGGARIIYVDIAVSEKIYLLLAYPKNVQDDLTDEQLKALRKRVALIKGE